MTSLCTCWPDSEPGLSKPTSLFPFPSISMPIERVCSSCFGDPVLRAWIRAENGPRGCDACGGHDSPTLAFRRVASRIEEGIRRYYGRAVDQLPYESAEGGYIGRHWDSWEMLDMIGLSLPRDDGSLNNAIAETMIDEVWCDFDWLSLEPDEALRTSWQRFCHTVKHKRRFFFHATGRDDQDSYTPASLLGSIARIIEGTGLVRKFEAGMGLWRARTDLSKGRQVRPSDFGPPPVEHAVQSNRMNPAGIPMLYLSSTIPTALKETRSVASKVGMWRTTRPLHILDLRRLPSVPGMFSDESRTYSLSVDFLCDFARDIMKPVARDNRVHIDYLPSQVVTEFIRDYPFEHGKVDGIAYGSTVHPTGWNVALFLGPEDLGMAEPQFGTAPPPSLEFVRARWGVLKPVD